MTSRNSVHLANQPGTPYDGAFKKANKKHEQTEKQRPKWAHILGQILLLMTVVSFLWVGLFIVVLQTVLMIVLRFTTNHQWRIKIKKCSGFLLYVFFSPVATFSYHWCNLTLNIQLEDLDLLQFKEKPHLAIVLANHSYEMDFMACFGLSDQLGNLGSYKAMAKDELKYLPVIGWTLWLSEFIFLKRNWDKDRKILRKSLDAFYDYYHCILGVFAEGTRWTEEKHKISAEYAKNLGLEPFKHHLTPRTRGFCYTVRHYLRNKSLGRPEGSQKLFKVLNMQIVMPDKPTFSDWLQGRTIRADILCEEVKISQEICDEVLNSKDYSDCPKLVELLYAVYRRKDELVDLYRLNGNQFIIDPDKGGPMPISRRSQTVFLWFIGFCFTYIPLAYLAIVEYSDSVIFWTLMAGLILGSIWMINKIERESKAKNSSRPFKCPQNHSARQPMKLAKIQATNHTDLMKKNTRQSLRSLSMTSLSASPPA